MSPSPPPVADQSLDALLEVERRLEARIREAERAAGLAVQQAQAELDRAGDEVAREVEALATAAERVDLEAHAQTLRLIEAERAAEVGRLAALGSDRVDALARRALARVAGLDDGEGAA